jgi:hypothetical protein
MIQRVTDLSDTGKSMWLTLHTGQPTFWNMVELPPVEVPRSIWMEIKPERHEVRTFHNLQPVVVARRVRNEVTRVDFFAFWRMGGPRALSDMLFDGCVTSWQRTLPAGATGTFRAGDLRLHINPLRVS